MITFAKAHAYGNDFLYVRESEVAGVRLPELTVEMCDRHTGVGADGLIIYASNPAGASMRLFNADGGRAEVSGNGVRGLGALLGRQEEEVGLVLIVDTEGGEKRLVRVGMEGERQIFRASMGLPSQLRKEHLSAAGETVEVVTLAIGNPQAILLGPLPDDERFARLGAALERHAHFPEGTNVEFAHVESPSSIRIRIWERGVGPTSSSGTGSCASLVAAAAYGGAKRDAVVVAPGGSQRVEWLDDSVYLTGWAEVLCFGEWLRPLPR